MAARSGEEQPLLPTWRPSSPRRGTVCLAILSVVVLLAFLTWCCVEIEKQAEYSVAISAVSGLDPATDQGRPALDPAFNMMVRVASLSALKGECIEPGTTVEVSYLRVPLATGPAPELCAPAQKEREEGSVIAWGNGVRLPGFVLDSLAADMRRGAPEFGVKLTSPTHYCQHQDVPCQNKVKVVACRVRIGDGSTSPAPCAMSLMDPILPVQPAGRDAGYVLKPVEPAVPGPGRDSGHVPQQQTGGANLRKPQGDHAVAL